MALKASAHSEPRAPEVMPLVMGSLLPTTRLSAWTVTVEIPCWRNHLSKLACAMWKGAFPGLCAWKMAACCAATTTLSTTRDMKRRFPTGFSVERYTHNMAAVHGPAIGTRVGVYVDHDRGELSFGINGMASTRLFAGFPSGAAFRLCALLWGKDDRLSLVRGAWL